jgi:hypothetical protein
MTPDGIGKPAQLTTAAGGPFQPRSVVQTDRSARKRAMVLLRTGRAAGSVTCHVDLVDFVELRGEVPADESGEAGTCRRPGNDRRRRVEFEQITDIVGVVTRGDDIATAHRKFLDGSCMGSRTRNDDHGARTNPVLVPDHDALTPTTQRFDESPCNDRIGVVYDDLRVTASEQATRNGRADTTGTDDSDHGRRHRSDTIS